MRQSGLFRPVFAPPIEPLGATSPLAEAGNTKIAGLARNAAATKMLPVPSYPTAVVPSRPVLGPVISRVGATFPDAPGANTSTASAPPNPIQLPQFATYKLPCGSNA